MRDIFSYVTKWLLRFYHVVIFFGSLYLVVITALQAGRNWHTRYDRNIDSRVPRIYVILQEGVGLAREPFGQPVHRMVSFGIWEQFNQAYDNQSNPDMGWSGEIHTYMLCPIWNLHPEDVRFAQSEMTSSGRPRCYWVTPKNGNDLSWYSAKRILPTLAELGLLDAVLWYVILQLIRIYLGRRPPTGGSRPEPVPA